ncbi:MAG: sensor domain-containing diguanylate cyclase [Xanthomonadaceae bacterium]|nr:sensor domain-containing diguanylate cyclase [Xanthomonadaceae bacterium]
MVESTPEEMPELAVVEAQIDAPEMTIEKEEDHSSSPALQDEILKLASYADLFDRMLEFAFIIDAESMNLLASNPAAERELGMTPEVFKGKGLSEFVVDDHKEDFIKKLRKAKRSYYLFEFDANWKISDGALKTLNFAACKLKLKNEQEVLQIIARDVTELREAQKRLKEMSVTDEMTKLPNFRRFKEKLIEEHDRCKRYGKEYAIVFCDVDNFKHYNDRNGHPAGDDILREVGKVMAQCARNTDLPARYGGEEFVVLCPEVNWNSVLFLAERIRTTLSSLTLPHSDKQPLGCISVSIGVSSFPHDGATYEEVLHAADQALYFSKKNGRNRVTPHQTVKGQVVPGAEPAHAPEAAATSVEVPALEAVETPTLEATERPTPEPEVKKKLPPPIPVKKLPPPFKPKAG